jgi:hypothetical protein
VGQDRFRGAHRDREAVRTEPGIEPAADQKVRTLPLRSSDAGTMYPLMRKKTKTP